MKKELIRAGKIDVGIPIVSIDYTTMKINKQGKLVGWFYKLLITLLL